MSSPTPRSPAQARIQTPPAVATQSSQALATAAQAAPDDENENTRPRKKTYVPKKNHKSTVHTLGRLPARDERVPDLVTPLDHVLIFNAVSKFMEGEKTDKARGMFPKCKKLCGHLRDNVIKHQIAQARKRIMQKRAIASRKSEAELEQPRAQVTEASVRAEETETLAAECERLKAEVKEREDALAKSEAELKQQRAQVTESSARAEKNRKLAAECERLKAEVKEREDALAHTKAELQASQKRVEGNTNPDRDGAIAALKEKVDKLGRQVNLQEAALKEKEAEERALGEKIQKTATAKQELQQAQAKLDKVDVANAALSLAFKLKSKKLQELEAEVSTARRQLVRQKDQHQEQLTELQMRARSAQEEMIEANWKVDLLDHAIQVEKELKEFKMAVRARCDHDRESAIFEDHQYWNNATLADLAIHVLGTRGCDRILLDRHRKSFHQWRDLRNDICHTPQGYMKYLPEASSLIVMMRDLCELVRETTVWVTDSSDRRIIEVIVGKTCENKTVIENKRRRYK